MAKVFFQIYSVIGFLNIVPILYGIIYFQKLGKPHKAFTLGFLMSFGVWLLSYIMSHFKLGNTHFLLYCTPLLYSIFYAFFYRFALSNYKWSKYLLAIPLAILSYTLLDLYLFGQKKIAIDLMISLNLVLLVLGGILLNNQLHKSVSFKKNGLFWLNGSVLLSSFIGVVTNLLLNRLYQYQNNDWFYFIYYGFSSAVGCFNIILITYSFILERRSKHIIFNKIPDLEQEL